MKFSLNKIGKLHRKVSDAVLWGGIVGVSYMMRAQQAMAQTLGGDLTQGANDIKSGANSVLSTGAYVIGSGLVIGGVAKVVEHVRQPQQTPLKHGLIGIGGGAAMVGVTAVIEHAMQTMNLNNGGTVAAPTFSS